MIKNVTVTNIDELYMAPSYEKNVIDYDYNSTRKQLFNGLSYPTAFNNPLEMHFYVSCLMWAAGNGSVHLGKSIKAIENFFDSDIPYPVDILSRREILGLLLHNLNVQSIKAKEIEISLGDFSRKVTNFHNVYHVLNPFLSLSEIYSDAENLKYIRSNQDHESLYKFIYTCGPQLRVTPIRFGKYELICEPPREMRAELYSFKHLTENHLELHSADKAALVWDDFEAFSRNGSIIPICWKNGIPVLENTEPFEFSMGIGVDSGVIRASQEFIDKKQHALIESLIYKFERFKVDREAMINILVAFSKMKYNSQIEFMQEITNKKNQIFPIKCNGEVLELIRRKVHCEELHES